MVLALGGLALLMASLGGFAYFEDVAAARWLDSPTVANSSGAVITFFIVGNVAAVGLALLLSGLQNLSLVKDPLARRAMLARLAASNLMLFCLLFAAVIDTNAFDRQIECRRTSRRRRRVGARALCLHCTYCRCSLPFELEVSGPVCRRGDAS